MLRNLPFLFLLPLFAQDTRSVSEPRIPASCAVLDARLTSRSGLLTDAEERTSDTARIQSAIDACAPGKAVVLQPSAGNVFLSGPLRLKPGVALVISRDAALWASRNPRDFDAAPGSCGIVSASRGRGCRPLILAEDAPGSAVMGNGSIDGRGGANLLGLDVSWWDLAKQAKILDQMQACPRLVVIRRSDNFILYNITLRNSPNFHVSAERLNGFTAWGVRIRTPHTARNTDGIDPSASTNVTIAHCDIDTGDDNVAIKADGPVAGVTIEHNRFYHGHGMSIGSGTAGGLRGMRVNDLSIQGADNGIRIKSDRSRGGLIEDVEYKNVCMRDVMNPIVLTSMYTVFPGSKLPVYRNIVLWGVRAVTPGYVTLLGVDEQHKIDVTYDNVVVDEIAGGRIERNVDLKVAATNASPISCDGRFPAFPEDRGGPAAAVKIPEEDRTLYVSTTGTGDYWSIQRAVDVAPATGAVISLAPGTYREAVTINKPNIRLAGSHTDPKETVIVFDKSAGTHGGTFKSATVDVHAPGFQAENITFANDFNATHPQTPQGSQALALSIVGDGARLRNVRLLGNQDTLYLANGRQHISDCYIEGNVDFIFGNGKLLMENCEIRSTPHVIGYITAQGRKEASEDSLYVFDRCRLTAFPGVTNVWLGRPWRPYASVVFLNTEMGEHIAAAGWREWHPGETAYMNTVFYAEYNSTGPGAHKAERDPHTRHLTAEEAAKYKAAVQGVK